MRADLEGLASAAQIVANGGVICYPTDTVYGLGCDPLNSSAVQRVIEVKGGRRKSMPVLVKTLDDADRFAYVSESARKLVRQFWPGPLTIVLPAKGVLASILVPEGTVGLRSPNHAICLELLGMCSGALVGTSANLTGKPPATSAEEAAEIFGDSVDLVLDGGSSTIGIASTVVDLTRNHLEILREGPIGRKEIFSYLRAPR